MAIGAVVISDYLAVFWGELDDGRLEIVIAGLARSLFVAVANVRGLTAERLGMVLRLSLLEHRAARWRSSLIALRPALRPDRDHRLRRARRGARLGRVDLRHAGRHGAA